MVDDEARPWIVDFSFSEVAASQRAIELDVAELLASLAARVGPERAVDSAAAGDRCPARRARRFRCCSRSRCRRRPARPCRAATSCWRRTRGRRGRGRSCRPTSWRRSVGYEAETLIMIALAAGAFYFILPQTRPGR